MGAMCFADDARPPAPPVQGPVAEQGPLVLESADGTRFGAYRAHPSAPSNRAIVIFPDVRGLHPFYEELAIRWAEAGLHAVAVDYFARTAGIGERGEEFPFRDHLAKLDFATVALDVSAAVTWLRQQTGATAVFTVGFCFGGAMSWRQAAAGDHLAGAIGFYGIPSRVTEVADRIADPLLLLAAGQDFTPVSEVEAFAQRVRAGGAEARLHVYPDAPHSFFDKSFGEHRADCADAWHQMLAFVDHYSV
jgi:carboxymethylenebutenolidase